MMFLFCPLVAMRERVPVWPMSLVHNERVKHVSSWFNALATALVTAGTFAPGAALLYGISDSRFGTGYAFAVGVACFAIGVGLHFGGRAMLGRLRE
jgi:hypothetical protein